jgi:7-cyano-7-deazaguanine reductase
MVNFTYFNQLVKVNPMSQKPYTSDLTLLGESGTQPQKKLETFPAPERGQVIELSTKEFTSFCPVTNQPDFGKIYLIYIPEHLCLETKSLKLYWQSFRSETEFWEYLAKKMKDDFVDVLDPLYLSVTVIQNPRGGIPLSVTSDYIREGFEDDIPSPIGSLNWLGGGE